MKVSYKKLFKLLIGTDMKKYKLCKAANISSSSITKLVYGKNVSIDVLIKICPALCVGIDGIMDLNLMRKSVDPATCRFTFDDIIC